MADAILRQTSFGDFRITVRNQSALIANIHQFGEEALAEIHEVTRFWAEAIQERAIDLAPIWVNDPPPPHHPGFLKDHIRLEYSEGGFAFEVGCWTADFDAIGENNYAIFQEYGTSRHEAQPFLNPAYEWGAPQYQRDVVEVIRQLAAEANR